MKSMPALRHDDNYYETPWKLFRMIEKETGLKFKTDLCATAENTKVKDNFITESYDLFKMKSCSSPMWCNPPRSKNGKVVNFLFDYWKENNVDIVMLLCWNDLGNKYGEKLLPHIIDGTIIVRNLGKVIFDKNGVPSEFPSRLTYFYAWFTKK